MTLSRQWPRDSIGRRFNAVAVGGAMALVGLLGLALEPFAHVEQELGLPWLFNLRGPLNAPDSVVIVAIDEELDLSKAPRPWPPPRGLHAEVIAELIRSGARLVVFDMTFEKPGDSAADDAALVQAMAQAGRVLVAESVRTETRRVPAAGSQPAFSVIAERTVSPFPDVAEAALGKAPFLLPKESRVATFWTFRDDGRESLTLPVLAFHFVEWNAYRDFIGRLHEVLPQSSLRPPPDDWQWLQTDEGMALVREARAAMQDRRVAERLPRAEAQQFGDTFDRLYAESNQRFLNFYGPPRSIQTVPYARVLQAARSPSGAAPFSFRDKVVFVGYSAATQGGQDRLRDDYRTVFSQPSGLDLSGVEIAATAYANLVEDRPLRPLPPLWQGLLLAAWGMALGVAGRVLRPTRALALAGALALAYMWAAFTWFASDARWLPTIVPVGIQLPLAIFCGLWLSYRDAKRERELVKRAFGYFLPSSVVEQLAHNLGPVTHDNRVVFGACLSTDVENYTSLAERMSPAALGDLMNEYFAQLFVPVERSSGVVVDVVGDAMVAIWAKASSDEEIRMNACRAALEIGAALDAFNRDPRERPALPTRLGLHAGDVLVGNIGASGHYEYRAVGDIVNTASRIQGLNKLLGTRLLASELTMAGLDEFAVRPLGSFLLPGKANAVTVVELLGWKHLVDAGQTALCMAFAQALAAFREGRLRDADERFSEMLATHPADGPARFYKQHCERLLREPSRAEWDTTIRVDAK